MENFLRHFLPMLATYTEFIDWLKGYPGAYETYFLTIVFIVAWIVNLIVKTILIRGLGRILKATILRKSDVFQNNSLFARLANIVPAVIIYRACRSELVKLHSELIMVIQLCCVAFIILTIARALSSALDIVNTLWQKRADAAHKPIKGYLQVVKIGIYSVAAILVISTFIGKSPVIIFSGLGAMAAVLMLVFQDTLLSLVASIQISSNNMIKIGDWIEMPQVNADGDVVDIALHTVTVQNWDRTTTTIPIKKFMTDSFKNWRGMEESGGRRIKRSIYLDQTSIHFLTKSEEKHLRKFYLLHDYLQHKELETGEWNRKLNDNYKVEVNYRRLTNIGTFRAYVEQYLHRHDKIHKEMTILVRQLSPTAEGLPLELYCFTNDTRWLAYESIQSDIFDHMLAILPEFGLRVFQSPSGADVRELRVKHVRNGRAMNEEFN